LSEPVARIAEEPMSSSEGRSQVMTQYKDWMIALFSLLLLAFSGWTGSVNAQPAPTPPGDYGGPFIMNPKNDTPEETRREIQIEEEHCRAHPDACIPDKHPGPTAEQMRHPEEPWYWATPDPSHTHVGPTTSCRPDPDHPGGPQICTDCRTNPADPEHPVCVRLIPGETLCFLHYRPTRVRSTAISRPGPDFSLAAGRARRDSRDERRLYGVI
jgi:hypothetical protein